MSDKSEKTENNSSTIVELPVNEQWLVDTLNAKCDAKGTLASYTCKGIAEGKGFLSFITRVKLEWNKEKSQGLETLPTGIIIKKPTTEKMQAMDERMKEAFNLDVLIDVHNRECQAYTFFNKHPPPPFPMARFFHSEEMTKEAGSGMLILEDITDIAISLSFVQDASIEQIFEVTDYVASLQAYGLNNPDVVNYLRPMEHDPFEDMFKNIESGLDEVRLLYPGLFPYSNEEFRNIFERRSKICPMFAKAGNLELTKLVALGDVQPNNILWHRNGPNNDQPSSKIAAFIDFQACHMGNCMIDIANTMTMGFPTEDRRANTNAVIDRYLTQLRAKTHANIPIPVTKAEAVKIQQEMMFQYASLCVTSFPIFMKFIPMSEERKKIQFNRMLAAVHDSLAALEGK